MMGHNIHFEGVIRKIIPKLSLLLLIWSTVCENICNSVVIVIGVGRFRILLGGGGGKVRNIGGGKV